VGIRLKRGEISPNLSQIVHNHPVATRPRYAGPLVIPADVPRQPRHYNADEVHTGPLPVVSLHRFNEIRPYFSPIRSSRPTSALRTAGHTLAMETTRSMRSSRSSARSPRIASARNTDRSTVSEQNLEQLREIIQLESQQFARQAEIQCSELRALIQEEAIQTAQASQRLDVLTARLSAQTDRARGL
jgi:hypothetical protein